MFMSHDIMAMIYKGTLPILCQTILRDNSIVSYDDTNSSVKIRKNIYMCNPLTHTLLKSFMVISDVTGPSFQIKLHLLSTV